MIEDFKILCSKCGGELDYKFDVDKKVINIDLCSSCEEQSRDEAYDLGREEESDIAYDKGFSDGTSEGYNEGFNEGLNEGHNRGYEEGWREREEAFDKEFDKIMKKAIIAGNNESY